jgi:hypothetical protein
MKEGTPEGSAQDEGVADVEGSIYGTTFTDPPVRCLDVGTRSR